MFDSETRNEHETVCLLQNTNKKLDRMALISDQSGSSGASGGAGSGGAESRKRVLAAEVAEVAEVAQVTEAPKSSAIDRFEYERVWSELKQKDADLMLAAEIGKDLLETNANLKSERDRLRADFSATIEQLEQERHQLQRKITVIQSEYEARIYDMQTEINELSARLERRQLDARQQEKNSTVIIGELSAQNKRIGDQLKQAYERELELRERIDDVRECYANKQLDFEMHVRDLLTLDPEMEMGGTSSATGARYMSNSLDSAAANGSSLSDIIEHLMRKIGDLKRKFDEQAQQMAVLRNRLVDMDKVASGASGSVFDRGVLIENIKTLRKIDDQLRHQSGNSMPDTSTDSGLSFDENCSPNSLTTLDNSELHRSLLQLIADVIRQINEHDIVALVQIIDELRTKVRDSHSSAQKTDECTHRLRNELALMRIERDSFERERNQLRDDLATMHLRLPANETIALAFRARDVALAQQRHLDTEIGRLRADLVDANRQLLASIDRKVELAQQIEQWQCDIAELLDEQLKTKLRNATKSFGEAVPTATTTTLLPDSRNGLKFLFKMFR